MRIAWFTPFARTSAIGKYSAILLTELANSHDITVFADGVKDRADTWLPGLSIVLLEHTTPEAVMEQLPGYDTVIYNLGDNLPFHQNIYEVSQKYPGIVILHDLVMHHFFHSYYLGYLQSHEGYLSELRYAHGEAGYELGKSVIENTAGEPWMTATMLNFNMAKSAVRGAYGVITHSKTSAQTITAFASAPVRHLFFPTPDLELRADRGRHKKVHILTFGVLNANKQVHTVIEAIGKSKTLKHNVIYEVIGSGKNDYVEWLESLMSRYQLQNQVKLLGYQPDQKLHDLLASSDIVVNLRNPHFGESSISLIEAMAVGKPTIVWNHGFYSEFPDNTVIKVGSDDEVQSALERLTKDHALRRTIGHNAAQYIKENFVTERTAQQIIEFIEYTRYNTPVFRILDWFIREMKQMGVDEQFPVLPERVITTLDELI